MGQSSTFLLQEVNEPSRMQKGEWGIGKGASPPSFEPTASALQGRRSTRLSYGPIYR